MFELTDQVFNAVFALDEEYRKSNCLSNCEEHNVICILKGNDGAPLMLEDSPAEDEEAGLFHTTMPVWCHPRYAQYYMDNSMDDHSETYQIAELSLELFKKSWIPVLLENKIALAFMPLEKDKMFCIESADIFLKTPEQRQAEANEARKAEAAEIELELKEMEKSQNKQ